jgi:hypothetical protein
MNVPGGISTDIRGIHGIDVVAPSDSFSLPMQQLKGSFSLNQGLGPGE